jgi:hypothetical protein
LRTLLLLLLLTVLTASLSISCWGQQPTSPLMMNPAADNCAGSDVLIVKPKKNAKSYTAGGACKPIFLKEATNTMLLGEVGTLFTADKCSIEMRPGKIVVFAGQSPVEVSAGSFLMNMPAECVGIVQLLPNGLLRVQNLHGRDVVLTFTTKRANRKATEMLWAGKEICVTLDESFAGEELFPVDGVDREPVVNSVMILGCKYEMSAFDVKMMIQKEPLLNCIDVHSIKARTKIRRLWNEVEKLPGLVHRH